MWLIWRQALCRVTVRPCTYQIGHGITVQSEVKQVLPGNRKYIAARQT